MDSSAYFHERRQGDIVSLATPGMSVPGDFVLVSQSCDVVLAKRENVLFAPLVELADGATRRGALNRENPRYVAVQLDSDNRFADLNRIISISKDSIAGAPASAGIDPADDQRIRDFGLAVGRWFGRFAFPDEVQPWLEPLQKQIRDKYEAPASSLGRVLHQIAEIRVEADSWSSQPCALTIHVIIAASSMPIFADEDGGKIDDIARNPSGRALTKIAEEILETDDAGRIVALWDELAWALADSCKPRAKFAEIEQVRSAVAGVEAMVWTDDDFPLSRYRKSEQLDVDFLSDPIPL